MGCRNLDRIGFDEWAQHAPEIVRMARQGWQVRAECSTCGLKMAIDLDLLVRLRGPRFSLWGKRTRCRDLRCRDGVMEFWARPPGGRSWGRMDRQPHPEPIGKPCSAKG